MRSKDRRPGPDERTSRRLQPDRLPKPETLVNGAYDVAEQLLSAQRKFANDVLQVTAPLTGQGDQS